MRPLLNDSRPRRSSRTRVRPQTRSILGAIVVLFVAVPTSKAQDTGEAPPPSASELEPWLGRYEAGPETVAISWREGPAFHLGLIVVPMDGRWHETVATFAVRHRVTWDRQRKRIRFEEQHNEGAHWFYEYALDGAQLIKVIPAGAQGNDRDIVKRRYRRAESN